MQIAIIGAGFSGLALCYYLTKNTHIQVTLFDSGLSEGASRISSGLVHPYAGAQCRRTKFATEGMKKTQELLQVAQGFIEDNVAHYTGILRPAITPKQLIDYQGAANLYQDVTWWDDCKKTIPYLNAQGGLFIASGITVHPNNYLDGLVLACKAQGATFLSENISSLTELSSFDTIIVAAGSLTPKLPELKELPVFPIRGQIIELEWPKHLSPLPFSLVSNGYVTMHPNNTSCFVGATYERGLPVDAEKELRGKVEALMPDLKESALRGIKSGVRLFSPDNLTPIIGHVNSNIWVMTALGSKGLLYHAYMAELLSNAIITNTPESIPKELRFRL